MKHGLKSRRLGVLERFEEQLVSGVKPVKRQPGKTIPLTDKDRTRITKEIGILETHLKKM